MPALAGPSKFTELVEGWAPATPARQGQIARLQSYLEAARDELAGRHQDQLALFRRPRLDASTPAARDWLDSILIPQEPKDLWFLVRIVSTESGVREGIWYGFSPDSLLGGVTLRLGDEDGSLGSTLHIAPSNLVSVEILEVRSFHDEEWY